MRMDADDTSVVAASDAARATLRTKAAFENAVCSSVRYMEVSLGVSLELSLFLARPAYARRRSRSTPVESTCSRSTRSSSAVGIAVSGVVPSTASSKPVCF
jgi:hypothetical protein